MLLILLLGSYGINFFDSMTIFLFISLFSLFLIYWGYFFIIWVAAKLFPEKNPSPSVSSPKIISIIIPVRNEEQTIQEKLENTLLLQYGIWNTEIIVIDSSSSDKTAEIVQSFAPRWVILYQVEHHGKAYALQRWIDDFCSWDCILITDVSAHLPIDALEKAVGYLNNPDIAWVTASLTQKEKMRNDYTAGSASYWQYETQIREYESIFFSCVGFTWKFSFFRKEIFFQKKWYFPWDADDFDMTLFAILQKKRVIQARDIFVYETAPNNKEDIFKQRLRIFVQTISSLSHYTLRLPFSKFTMIIFLRRILPLLSPLFIIMSLFALYTTLELSFFSFWIFIIGIAITFLLKSKSSFLKKLYYVLLLNVIIVYSYFVYLSWRDFTRWDKILSTRK